MNPRRELTPERRRELERLAAAVEEAREDLAVARAALDAGIARARADGAGLRPIAEAAGISHARVSQVLAR